MATAGDDSGSDVSDTEVETHEDCIFYDELVELFMQSMADNGLFQLSIIEINALRNMFNQSKNAVMEMVMQGLLMLPTIFWRQVYEQTSEYEQRKNAAFTRQYFDQLREVLRRFQDLVAHFAKWKNVKEYFKLGIEKAIELLHRQLILRTRQDVVDLLRVIEDEICLRFDDIFADLHAGTYGETPNEALPFGTIPLYAELPPDITGETSQSQKPSPDTDVQERSATDTVAPDTLASSAVETLALQTQSGQNHSTAETVTLDSPPDQEPSLTEIVTLDPLVSPTVETISSWTQGQGRSAIETLASDAPRVQEPPMTETQPPRTHTIKKPVTSKAFVSDTPDQDVLPLP